MIILAVVAVPFAAEAAEGFLDLHVEPATVDVPEPALKGRRHWKILASPPPQVVVDEPFRTRLQGEIDAALKEDHPWIADLRSEWSLISRLTRTLAAAQLKFPQGRVADRATGRQITYVLPPAEGEGPAHLVIPFTYVLTEMARLRIEVSSASDAPSTAPATQEPLPPDLRDTLPADNRDALAERITFQLRGKDAQLAPGEAERLRKVARHAFTVVAQQNALPPRPVVDESVRDRIVLILRATLVPQPQPVKSAITFGPDPSEPGLWVLAIRGLTVIEGVRIEGRYDLATLLAPGTTVDDRTQARFTAKAAEVSADLDRRFAKPFEAVRGTVLVGDELDALIGRLKTEDPDRIATVEDPRLDGGILILPVVIKPTVKTLVGSVGLGYTPREGVTGTAGITGQNLLGWNDSISFDLKGGPDNRRGDFDFSVPLPSRWWNDDERLSARVSLHGLYSRALDTVLGQPRQATVDEEENAVRLRQSLIFRPFARRGPEAPGGGTTAPSSALGLSESTALGLDAEIGRRDVELRGVAAPPGTPLDGVAAPLLVTFRASTGFEPRDKTEARVRLVDLRLESTFEQSFSIFGSDLTYQRWDVRASVEGVFWWFSRTPRNDVLLRYVHGYGTANDGTPLFRFLRVGGESNVRGVEEGEFIGRRLQYQQVEAGVSLCALQHLVFPRKDAPAETGAAAKAAPAGPECQAGGFDLSRAFVKVFVDHADVAERAVGRRLESGSKSIFGTGVALELHGLPLGNQRLSLTIGYAYSPDSERHRSGTAFTQVVMPFSLR